MLSGTAKKKGMAEGLEGEGETSTKWEVQRGAWGGRAAAQARALGVVVT